MTKKFRFVKEMRPNGLFFYSTEEQLSGGAWVYVTGTAATSEADGLRAYELARRRVGDSVKEVLRQDEAFTFHDDSDCCQRCGSKHRGGAGCNCGSGA